MRASIALPWLLLIRAICRLLLMLLRVVILLLLRIGVALPPLLRLLLLWRVIILLLLSVVPLTRVWLASCSLIRMPACWRIAFPAATML